MSNVIELENYTFEKKERYSRFSGDKNRCNHRHFSIDDHGHTVHCADCGDQISAYWMLNEVLAAYVRKMSELSKEQQKAKRIREDLEKEHRFLNVLKDVHRAWRGRNKMAVCCPHCGIGIMPEDGLGRSKVNPQYNLVLKRERDKRIQNEM